MKPCIVIKTLTGFIAYDEHSRELCRRSLRVNLDNRLAELGYSEVRWPRRFWATVRENLSETLA